MAIQALLVILAVLLVLLFLGVPISYAIAVSSLTAILSSIDLNVAVLTAAQRTFVGMSKFSLTAIPFFILAGNIMNQGGIAKRLVDFVMAILGKMPGALLVTNIGTNALFGAISGSASAAAAAVGSMIRDGAEEQGYDPAVTAATNAASSCSGLLIPPSNALITYSLASGGTSVAALFMAGYIPGIIWALCCCVVGVLLAVKLGYKGTPGKFDWKNLGICTLRALPSLSLIIVVIGGIIGGRLCHCRCLCADPCFLLPLHQPEEPVEDHRGLCQDVRHGGVPCRRFQHSGLGHGLFADPGCCGGSPAEPDQQ